MDDSLFEHIGKQITDLSLIVNEKNISITAREYTKNVYAIILDLFKNLNHLSTIIYLYYYIIDQKEIFPLRHLLSYVLMWIFLTIVLYFTWWSSETINYIHCSNSLYWRFYISTTQYGNVYAHSYLFFFLFSRHSTLSMRENKWYIHFLSDIWNEWWQNEKESD